MAVFLTQTGMLKALLLDNGYLTDVRTAAAGAVAAKYLARQNSETAAILGAGTQAKLQLKALTLVRPIKRVRLWARDPKRTSDCAAELQEELGLEVSVASTPKLAIIGADIIVTTTPSSEPLVEADWLQPGQHITAMGSDCLLYTSDAADE